MAKVHSKYVCQSCEYEATGWLGRCPNCGEWNTLVETIVSTRQEGERVKGKDSAKSKSLSEIKVGKDSRISTKISELDRVLGGGLIGGQVVLLAGEPGIGKSSLLLQVAQNLCSANAKFLYVSGEESVTQIKIRSDRMGIKSKGIDLVESNDVDAVINTIYDVQDFDLRGVVVDSIQTVHTDDLSGMEGSVGQIRECASRLVKCAKSTGVPIIVVGHVTKEGAVAGPSVLMHIVDCVLWFEGDRNLNLRLLHTKKNRFGPTDEVGIFEMRDTGLTSLTNPEKVFLSGSKAAPGVVKAVVLHGSRPILIEIQSLVIPTKSAYPKRIVQGFDSRRLELLIAILSKRCGVYLYDNDVFLNIAGGFVVREPAVDLASCLSMASSYFDKALPKDLVAIGEVALSGEIREVGSLDKRIKETKRLGLRNIVSSKETKYLSQAIKRYLQ